MSAKFSTAVFAALYLSSFKIHVRNEKLSHLNFVLMHTSGQQQSELRPKVIPVGYLLDRSSLAGFPWVEYFLECVVFAVAVVGSSHVVALAALHQ